MSKENGLQHIVWNGCTIHRDKGCIDAFGMVVNEFGEDLFSGTRRPIDENRDIGLRDTAGQSKEIAARLVTTRHGAIVGKHCGGELKAIVAGGIGR